jgi:hypothetical protein
MTSPLQVLLYAGIPAVLTGAAGSYSLVHKPREQSLASLNQDALRLTEAQIGEGDLVLQSLYQWIEECRLKSLNAPWETRK